MVSATSTATLVGLGIGMPALATLFVVLRYWSRQRSNTFFGTDDLFIGFGLIFAWILGVIMIIGGTLGDLGQPIGPPHNGAQRTIEMAHTEWAFQVVEKPAFGFVKLSVILFYRRIFVSKNFNIWTWSLIGMIIIWSTSFFFGQLFECGTKFYIIWSPDRELFFENCISFVSFLLAFAWTDVITDCIILATPIPRILMLNMPTHRKFAVLGIFMLGTLAVLAGIARLVFYYRASTDFHATETAEITAPTLYWSLIEICLGIVAASLPTIRPLFRGWSLESIIGSIRGVFSLHSMNRSQERMPEAPNDDYLVTGRLPEASNDNFTTVDDKSSPIATTATTTAV